MRDRTLHFCKWCESDFRVDVHEEETGDFILECPVCGYGHYRHFKDGIAVHCDIGLRDHDPLVLKGFRKRTCP